MNIRFLIDPDTELPHIYAHNVDEDEVRDVLRSPIERVPGGRPSSIIVHGRTAAGRFLKVVYSPEIDGVFVITAYDLPSKQLRALRRRFRGRL